MNILSTQLGRHFRRRYVYIGLTDTQKEEGKTKNYMQLIKFNKLMFSLFSKTRGRVGACNIYISDNEK